MANKDGCPQGTKYDRYFDECVPLNATKVKITMIVPEDDYENYEHWVDDVPYSSEKFLMSVKESMVR